MIKTINKITLTTLALATVVTGFTTPAQAQDWDVCESEGSEWVTCVKVGQTHDVAFLTIYDNVVAKTENFTMIRCTEAENWVESHGDLTVEDRNDFVNAYCEGRGNH